MEESKLKKKLETAMELSICPEDEYFIIFNNPINNQ